MRQEDLIFLPLLFVPHPKQFAKSFSIDFGKGLEIRSHSTHSATQNADRQNLYSTTVSGNGDRRSTQIFHKSCFYWLYLNTLWIWFGLDRWIGLAVETDYLITSLENAFMENHPKPAPEKKSIRKI